MAFMLGGTPSHRISFVPLTPVDTFNHSCTERNRFLSKAHNHSTNNDKFIDFRFPVLKSSKVLDLQHLQTH